MPLLNIFSLTLPTCHGIGSIQQCFKWLRLVFSLIISWQDCHMITKRNQHLNNTCPLHWFFYFDFYFLQPRKINSKSMAWASACESSNTNIQRGHVWWILLEATLDFSPLNRAYIICTYLLWRTRVFMCLQIYIRVWMCLNIFICQTFLTQVVHNTDKSSCDPIFPWNM